MGHDARDFGARVQQDQPHVLADVGAVGEGDGDDPPAGRDRPPLIAHRRRHHRRPQGDEPGGHLTEPGSVDQADGDRSKLAVRLVDRLAGNDVDGGERDLHGGVRAELDIRGDEGDQDDEGPAHPGKGLKPQHAAESTDRRPGLEGSRQSVSEEADLVEAAAAVSVGFLSVVDFDFLSAGDSEGVFDDFDGLLSVA